MIQTTVATRYAEALFAIAKENNSFDQLELELTTIDQAMEANEDFKKLLNHPHVAKEDKKRLLADVFATSISEVTVNFLNLLIDKQRQDIFSQIVKSFIVISNEARGIADATVVSVSALTDTQLEQIRATFKELIGKDLRITTEIDKDIIGGFIVRIGDRVYDSSIKTQLDRFKVSLREAQVGR
ncbi:F0F1 ATP synthase subunit delta [Desulfuribacillus alkaliarsenatis]|uniref:ATP synthase subunit delta n=1 Tax=Desulfuribacillus alkaliarsenatis TaxID=766136 RepID=A0A1E5G1J1_9FIRM|nr:F0F1 ATP synthase subunit delta [Desulfuribacillus alkaliarsenatis]OEF96778.1 ATP synthase F1 subunit delta [Desulfuribacillus alkaliarsenatis]